MVSAPTAVGEYLLMVLLGPQWGRCPHRKTGRLLRRIGMTYGPRFAPQCVPQEDSMGGTGAIPRNSGYLTYLDFTRLSYALLKIVRVVRLAHQNMKYKLMLCYALLMYRCAAYVHGCVLRIKKDVPRNVLAQICQTLMQRSAFQCNAYRGYDRA